MRRLWAAGAATLVCLALGGLPLTAQSPGAPEGNVWVTGTETCTQVTAGTTTYENGVEQYRDGVFACTATVSDPRVGGSFTDHFNFDCHELIAPQTGHGGCTLWGTVEWADPDGWTGSFSGLEDVNGQSYAHAVAVGTGANTGWTYIALTTWSDTSVSHEIRGLLFQGAPPAVPLPSASSE
jgi:hypothetical protein